MAFSYFCLISQRVLLPLILVLSSLYRPVGISFVYLLMFFVSPFIPIATHRNFKGTISAYLLLLIAISTLVILCHIGLQITLAAIGSSAIASCSVTERLLKHIGFISFFDQKPLVIIEWFTPDLLVLGTSIAVYFIVRSAVRERPEIVEEGDTTLQPTASTISAGSMSKRNSFMLIPNFDRLIDISPLFCLATLFFAGALRPSVQGGFYFLVFLLCGSYWATFKSLQRGFAIFMRFVALVLVLHIIAIVSYQLEWSQQYLPKDDFIARLLALEPLVNSGCNKYIVYNKDYNLDSYLSPIFILVAYYTLILSSNNLIQRRVSICRDRLPEPNESTPLVRHSTLRATTRRSLSQPPIQMDSLDSVQNEETTSSFFDQICYGIISIAGFIYQNSYIFTNILMMTWSIIYHCWFGFVFLLWANVMWMIPNQRKAMMRSSPIIVLYAEVLLIIQYLYCMNLNDDELPSKVNTTGINLEQIGLTKIKDNQSPYLPLLIKSAMLLMFWVTLRQFFKEKRDKRRTSTIADMVAPLQMAVGAANIGHKEKKKSSKFLKKMGDMLKNFLVRLWIWLLIFVIFLCAITGTQMTAFRVCYMALFLFFLLVFQLSSKIWVKVMYGFWIFLIIYAMTILTLIYTYQFDKFSTYWKDYLNVNETLQTDIGLQTYKTKELLLHLLPPTLIVILTVIQVHYFHKRFVASLLQQNSKRTDSTTIDLDGGVNAQSSTQLDESSETYLSEDASTSKFQNIKNVSKRFCQRLRSFTKNLAISFKEIFWRFLELHLIKGVYLTAFLCCIHELCILHIPAVFLCIVGYISRGYVKLYISKFISLVFCIITLTKMIYQVQYMDHKTYNVNCTNNVTGNNAEWFGLQKISETRSLVQIIKPYIVYMVIATLHAVVSLRQSRMRTLFQDSVSKAPPVLFPTITRADAEKNISGALKYLMNYGFYKFGLEITFIAVVGLAAYRKDIISILYIIWLCILIPLNRHNCARVWPVFLLFTGVLIILQYLLFVGLPPGICMEYTWTGTDISEALQAWALMPGDMNIQHNSKLIFDFIVFMFIYRQKKVFNVEAKNLANYPGGCNKSVISDIENLGLQDFENPTSDFLSSIRDWLDVIKNAILCGFFWVTLAVVFLAGTNIGDVLALGYLIGSFIFLWQGSDFYLRPIRIILKRWNILLAYNVFNIAVKVFLQLPACLYMKNVERDACFLIPLLGIKCSCAGTLSNVDLEEPYCTAAVRKYSFLVWDAVCFAFIILQLRIFKSHYFCHIINDTKANTLLASRGAEIIEDLRNKQIDHRRKHEQEVLLKIKKKMEKIRATQNKLRRTTDKPTHFDEKKTKVRKPLVTHPQAIRAGDYYMFDDVDEKFELDMIDDETDFLESEGKISEIDKKIAQRKNILDTEVKHRASASGLTPGSQKRHSPKQTHEEEEKTKDDVDASTSTAAKQADEEDVEEEEEEDVPMRNPFVRLLEGLLVSIAVRLNRFSRNYRYVMKILAEEKKTLKESKGFERLGRLGVASMWTPLNVLRMQAASLVRDEPQTSSQLISPNTHETDTNTDESDTNSEIVIDTQLVQSTPRKTIGSQGSIAKPSTTGSFYSTGDFSFEEEFADKDHHIIVQVLISLWYAILSNTDLICYTIVFISQCVNASILSLPLPIMVFLWGTLSLPRPTKTFWVTLIGYTQSLVLLKCIFQYKGIWKDYIGEVKNPLSFGSMIGLDLDSKYTTYDLVLLLVLFFHRFILKSQGLWKSEYNENIQEGAYVAQNDLPESENVGSQQSLDNTIMVAKGDQTIAMARTEQAVHDDQINFQLNTTSIQPGEYIPGIGKLASTKYVSTFKMFFVNIVKKARLPTDVYAFMFLCDFINFFVLLFGFTAFGSQQGGTDESASVQTYLEENKVPIPFLIMLLVQFLLIIADRALYLRKAIVYKIIFHFLSVVGIHIWMFFIIPAINERSFNSLAPPIIFYIIKCFYFLWSAYQIKCGFPKRILGNVLTKSFSLVNMILFKIYMNLPFLYELRTILDWVCTDTTMTLFDWLKMEDIFSDIYFIKCSRQMENDFPVVRAQKKAIISKLFLGGIIILMIVVAIWGPLCLFALANAVGLPNIPYQATLSIKIGSYDPLYEATTEENIKTFTNVDMNTFSAVFGANRKAQLFLNNYYYNDIAAVMLPGNSSSVWKISPPDVERLVDDLRNNKTLSLRFQYDFLRTKGIKDSKTASGSQMFSINETYDGRELLMKMLLGNSTEEDYITIPYLLPKFLKILNTGALSEVSDLKSQNENNQSVFRNLKLRLHPIGQEKNITNGIFWWEVKEDCNNSFYNSVLKHLPFASCENELVMYTFNDKMFPQKFSFLTSGGIIGLYTTFVILISKVLKGFLSGQNRKIMFEDLPYVDRVLQLCLDIYLVREALELQLEEDLFAKLLFLYRSPETMIKWTRPKEELNDDETDTESIRSSKGSGHRKQD